MKVNLLIVKSLTIWLLGIQKHKYLAEIWPDSAKKNSKKDEKIYKYSIGIRFKILTSHFHHLHTNKLYLDGNISLMPGPSHQVVA